MNYYQFHIGDFRSGTVNMSRAARWIYRDMIDVYYDTERPLPQDMDLLCEMLGVESTEERTIVERHLRFKFESSAEGYKHETCERIISQYKQRADVASENGKKAAKTRYQSGEYMGHAGTLYAVRVDKHRIKVGISANFKSRLHQLRNQYGTAAFAVHTVSVSHMGDAEAKVLDAYDSLRSGELIPIAVEDEVALISLMDRISVACESHTNHKPLTKNQEPKELKAYVPDAQSRSDYFDRFWKLYPKKKSKADAEKAWAKVKMSEEFFTVIIQALSLQCSSQDWTKEAGKYVPLAGTWIRGKRWEDEVSPAAQQKHNGFAQADYTAGVNFDERGNVIL